MGKKVEIEAEALERLQKLAALGQMGAGITHEVRNVMTGILGFAQVAGVRLEGDGESRQVVGMIEQEAQRCLEILSAFLDLARPGGQEAQRIEPRDLARQVARVAAHQLSVNQVRLELELDEGAPAVKGHAGALKQVLLNLVLNAMQAMQPRGGLVRLAVKGGPGEAILRVEDEGPGIAEEARGRLFEPFFTTKAVGLGTGLGLFVSRGIVEEHGGTIEAGSAPGRGAAFTIRIPAMKSVT